MSQNRGGRLVRPPQSDRSERPALDRPSLFAGMDNEDSTFDGDTQRVRILSTLESARRPSRGARHGPTKIHGMPGKKRGVWQTRLLMGLMVLGMLTLLASFVMVLLDGRPASNAPKAPASSQGVTTDTSSRKTALSPTENNPLAALIVPPPNAMMPPAQQAAVIETVINAPVPTQQATSTAGPLMARPATEVKVASTLPPSSAKTSPKVADNAVADKSPVKAASPAPQKVELPTILATPAPAPASPSRRTASVGRNDADVALLEAMFAHTRTKSPSSAPPAKQAGMSVADELKNRCGSLSGASAATCRAQICVQNPTAAACHQDP